MLLPKNHIALSCSREIDSILTSFPEIPTINFFDYGKFYDNGDCLFLANNPSAVNFLFEKEYALTVDIPDNLRKKESFHYLIPETGPYNKLLHEVKSFFNLVGIMDIIKRNENYYELFCFATHNNDTNQNINFYLNNKERLEYFTTYFKKSAHSIITSAENQLIHLPKHMRSNVTVFKKKQMALRDKFYLNDSLIDLKFTPREVECLAHLSHGWNTRDCAAKMALSCRTVESYINQIKLKIACNKKSGILKFINENSLAFHDSFQMFRSVRPN